MLFTEFKKSSKEKRLLENQLKELEHKLNDGTLKVKKLESSNKTQSTNVPRIYAGLDEIFTEGFEQTDPHLLSETNSEDEEYTECWKCRTEFKPTGKYIPCELKLPSKVFCPSCAEIKTRLGFLVIKTFSKINAHGIVIPSSKVSFKSSSFF